MNANILLAGFGGQGVLFAGKFLANIGLFSGHEVTWLPSYGPEMRGGTCNCSVIISETPIGNPVVSAPDILVALSLPALNKFEDRVAPGGHIFMDSSLIDREARRKDVTVHAIEAARIVEDKGLPRLANMFLCGGVISALGATDAKTIDTSMGHTVPERKQKLAEDNIKAVTAGIELVK